MRHILLILAILGLSGCLSNAHRLDDAAARAGLDRSIFERAGYSSVIYTKAAVGVDTDADVDAGAPLLIFLEGDGRPWRDGRVPNDDPTTARPLALRLLAVTPRRGVYLARPCYHALQPRQCTPDQWTNGRYSEAIVSHLTDAARVSIQKAGARGAILVGYSGGGTLAVLMAERLEHVEGVITIAANLDTEAWLQHHRYLPLTGSLNPAASTRKHSWKEVHLQGERDTVVPPTTTGAYFEQYPRAQRKVFAAFDHVCCWIEVWPEWLRTFLPDFTSEHASP